MQQLGSDKPLMIVIIKMNFSVDSEENFVWTPRGNQSAQGATELRQLSCLLIAAHLQWSCPVLSSQFSTRSHIKSVAKRLEKRMPSICLLHATMTETEQERERERDGKRGSEK